MSYPTGEENDASGDLARLGRSAHWTRELLLRILQHSRWNKRCPDGPWSNSVDSDAVSDLLVTETTSEGDDGALCECLVEEVRASNVCVDAGVVDNRGASLHVRQSVLCEVKVEM